MYELYKNVVVPFVNEVILEAERYAGKEPSYGEIEVPTSNWTSRTDIGPLEDPVKSGYASRGMSYSFGGKMHIDAFSDQVTRAPGCRAEATGSRSIVIFENNLYSLIDIASPAVISQGADSVPPVDGFYKGNLDQNCQTGIGSDFKYKYAGLRQHEKLSSEAHDMYALIDPVTKELIDYYDEVNDEFTKTIKLEQYSPTYWAGIDCSGLVQRSITRANNLKIPGVDSKVKDLGNFGSCAIDDPDCKPCGDPSIWSQSYMPTYARSIGTATGGKVSTDILKKAHKGDVVIYPHHISLVHSDKTTCKGSDCAYEIIHAYGGNCTAYERDRSCVPGTFARKVLRTPNAFSGFTEPTGLGRIKLWD